MKSFKMAADEPSCTADVMLVECFLVWERRASSPGVVGVGAFAARGGDGWRGGAECFTPH